MATMMVAMESPPTPENAKFSGRRSLASTEDDGSMDDPHDGGVFEGLENLKNVNKEKESLKAKLIEWYKADVAKSREVAHIAGKNMLQVSVCNLTLNAKVYPVPATMSHNSLLSSLENKRLDMNQVYSFIFANMTSTLRNNSIEYIMMKNNDYSVDHLIGEFTVAGHSVSVKKANLKAMQISFMKVPEFVSDAELVHFASTFGTVVNERGMIREKPRGLDLLGWRFTLAQGGLWSS